MPKKPRTTEDTFGRKLLQVLSEMGHADDLTYLASVFEVKVQSTYDWINHGRMAKDRFGRLVEWSGRSLHWWFDVPEPVCASGTPPVVIAAEPPPTYTPSSGLPFEDVPKSRFDALTERQKGRVEAALAREIDMIDAARGGNRTAA